MLISCDFIKQPIIFIIWLYFEFCKPILVFVMLWWDMGVLSLILWWFDDWISWKEFKLIWYYKLCFYDRKFIFDLQSKFCRIFGRNSSVIIKFDFMVLYRSSGIHFQINLGISMSCEFLGVALGNRYPLKGTRRLLHVRPPDRDVTISK